MKVRFRPTDTIGWRIALTVGAAIVGVLLMSAVFNHFAVVWTRPSVEEAALIGRANDIVNTIEIAPESYRQQIAKAVKVPAINVNWYSASSPLATQFSTAPETDDDVELAIEFRLNGHPRRLLMFESDSPLVAHLRDDRTSDPDIYFLAVALRDSSWVVFSARTRSWGLSEPVQIAIALAFVVVSILVASALATHFLSKPLRQFAEDLRRFGGDPRAGPAREIGPRELRAVIGAFNALQAQLRKFVEDRTAMLAAMSHDLRTPLTKIRLRGEFIDDENQRERLFRDVDELQAMADAALSFFRDDYKDEEATDFDFAGLIRTIADDYADQDKSVTYSGPNRFAFRGRPFSLRRVCLNLVDNALKYGSLAELDLQCFSDYVHITISDRGPGIPPHEFDQVFAPFHRLEHSRNRMTGGMGLGLTSARAIVRGHGGDIVLSNRPEGGLQVTVTLPIPG